MKYSNILGTFKEQKKNNSVILFYILSHYRASSALAIIDNRSQFVQLVNFDTQAINKLADRDKWRMQACATAASIFIR